jgi:hypothetical protein
MLMFPSYWSTIADKRPVEGIEQPRISPAMLRSGFNGQIEKYRFGQMARVCHCHRTNIANVAPHYPFQNPCTGAQPYSWVKRTSKPDF